MIAADTAAASLPACALLVTPQVVETAVSATGTVTTAITIPNTLALVGLVVHQQVIVLGLDLQQHWIESTSSNALSLTVGAF